MLTWTIALQTSFKSEVLLLALSLNYWVKAKHAHDLLISYMTSQLIHVDDNYNNIWHVTKH